MKSMEYMTNTEARRDEKESVRMQRSPEEGRGKHSRPKSLRAESVRGGGCTLSRRIPPKAEWRAKRIHKVRDPA